MIKEERYSRLAKEGSWVILGQIAAVLGALVLVRVLTEYLAPSEYGHLALGLTIAALINLVVMGGVSNGIGRYYSIASEKHDLTGYLQASRQLMCYATLAVFCIGFLLLLGLYYSGYSRWMGLAGAALVFSVLSGYNIALSCMQNAARQRAIVAFHGGLDAWLKIVLAVAVMFWLGNSSTAVVIGYTLSSLIVTASQLIFLKRLMRAVVEERNHSIDWVPQMWSYSWPFSVWGAFVWLQQSSDRWALEAFSTTQEVGFYAVLFQLGYVPVFMVTNMAMTFMGPILYQRAGEATDSNRNANVARLAKRTVYLFIIITLIGFLITAVFHEWFFRILVAAEYRVISNLLPWLVLAGGLFAAGQVIALKLMSDMRSSAMLWAKIVTALIGLSLNIFGAMFAGIRGVVGAWVVFSVIHFIWMALIGWPREAERIRPV